jgi:DsbE subfamily thiol:disulfide oxidoreductase
MPVLIFIAIVGFFAVALRSADPSFVPSTMIGKQVPEGVFPAIDGLEKAEGKPEPGFTTRDLAKGRVSVVNYWASWCVPCIEEHPLLEKLKSETDVDIYGINYKDRTEAARRFIGRYGNPFTGPRRNRLGCLWHAGDIRRQRQGADRLQARRPDFGRLAENQAASGDRKSAGRDANVAQFLKDRATFDQYRRIV